MPVDPDTQTITQWLLAALGIGGGGYKIVTHETRIARLESDHLLEASKTLKNSSDIAGMKGTLESVDETVNEIKNLLMNRGVR